MAPLVSDLISLLVFYSLLYFYRLQDGEVTVDEFKQAVQKHCSGKSFDDYPDAFKTFIASVFKAVDVNGMLQDPLNGVKRCVPSLRLESNACFADLHSYLLQVESVANATLLPAI